MLKVFAVCGRHSLAAVLDLPNIPTRNHRFSTSPRVSSARVEGSIPVRSNFFAEFYFVLMQF